MKKNHGYGFVMAVMMVVVAVATVADLMAEAGEVMVLVTTGAMFIWMLRREAS
jgi:hypothetical protein